MASNWLAFDRLRAYISGSGLYRHENILQDQPSLDSLTSAGPERNGLQSAIIQSIQVNYFRRERYKDYDKMDEMGEISLALDMYADESCVVNPETGHIIQVYGESTRVKEEVQNLYNKTLMLDHQCRSIVRYLCKYGDCAFRIVLDKTRTGVVGLKRLDVYNFTRIETANGDLVAFHYSDPEINQSYFLHPWEVVHFRLTNFEAKFHPYGKSVIEGGRKAFKQLILMESSAVIYRLCLTGDSKIMTSNGPIPIKDIKIGDLAYCYTEDGVKLTKVTNWISNGIQDVFRVKTKYRHLDATITHPFLALDVDTGNTEYVDVKNLVPGRHHIVVPTPDSPDNCSLPPQWAGVEYAKLSDEQYQLFRSNDYDNITSSMRELNHPVTLTRQFLYARKRMPLSQAQQLCEILNLDSNNLIVESKGIKIVPNIPKTANIDLMRYLGFIVGDGSVTTGNRITLAIGDYKPFNQWYLNYAKTLCPNSWEEGPENDRKVVSSNKILHNTVSSWGFLGTSKTKRIPGWVFGLSHDLIKSFITGFIEADGNSHMSGYDYFALELCNKNLVEDFKHLCDLVGYRTGKISTRTRESGLNHLNDVYTSYKLFVSPNPRDLFEPIESIDILDQQEVFDITVENGEHNFIANGMVVHNTRAPQKRKFTIPVGNIPSQQVPEYLRKIAAQFKNKKFYNPANGNFDERYAPLTQEDDFFLPKRPDGSGPDIETLQGADNLGQIDDIEYFLKKMIAPTKIPPSRLGIGDKTGGDTDGKPLSQTSSDFAKNITWVQQVMSVGLTKIALVHLALKGYSRDEMNSFWTSMMVNSAMEELYRIETWQTRANIMADLRDIGWFPKEWILSHFTDLSPDEIQQMMLKGNADMGDETTPELGGGGGGGDMGGGDLFGGGEEGGGEDLFGGGDEGGGEDLFGGEGGDDLGGGALLDAAGGEEDDNPLGESLDYRLKKLEESDKKTDREIQITEAMSKLKAMVVMGKTKRDNSIASAIIESNELLGVPAREANSNTPIEQKKDQLVVEGIDEVSENYEFEYFESSSATQRLYGELPSSEIISEAATRTIAREQLLLDQDRENAIVALQESTQAGVVTQEDVDQSING